MAALVPTVDTGEEKLSQLLARLTSDPSMARISLARLLGGLGDRSFGCALLVLALPAWIPVLPPPVRSVFGLPLGVIAAQMLLGRSTLVAPGWVARRSMERERASRIVTRARPWLERAERLARPRLSRFSDATVHRRLGALLLVNAALIAVPLPMTTSGPALATGVIALGLIERDGLFVVVGAVLSLLAMAATAVFWTGVWLGLTWTFGAAGDLT